MLSWSATIRCTCGDVAQALPVSSSSRSSDHEHLAGAALSLPAAWRPALVEGASPSTQALDHVHPAVRGPVRQRAAQRGGLHLLRRALGVTARLRAVDDATAGELRRAGRALTGAAGALLPVRLLAATADLAAGLGRVRALPRRGELATTTWWISGMLTLDVEDLGGQFDRAGRLPFASDSSRSPFSVLPSRALADEDQATVGTGDRALDEQQALLGVDGVHVRFTRWSRSLPIRPAILSP